MLIGDNTAKDGRVPWHTQAGRASSFVINSEDKTRCSTHTKSAAVLRIERWCS